MSTSLCSYNNTLYKQQTRPKKGGKKKKKFGASVENANSSGDCVD